MEIIKHGNVMREFAHFVCPSCGCEFEELVSYCVMLNFETNHTCPECGERCVCDRQYRRKVDTNENY